MTIRFSCECGAVFEVPEEQGGQRGRCRRCARELPIPHASPAPPEMEPPSPEIAPEEIAPAEESIPPVIRYCPYCGTRINAEAPVCPTCLRIPNPRRHDVEVDRSPLTTADWALGTLLPPLGMLHGFSLLLFRTGKGLDLIGISAMGSALWWLAVVIAWGTR